MSAEITTTVPSPPPLPPMENSHPDDGRESSEGSYTTGESAPGSPVSVESNSNLSSGSGPGRFDKMKLKEKLQVVMKANGLERPLCLQKESIKACLGNKDVLIQSPAETGKTISYIIAILEKIDPANKSCQALILAHSRQLALKIAKLVEAFGNPLDVISYACIGGESVKLDKEKLEKGVHVVVGTVGRTYDVLIQRKWLSLDQIKIFVVDEASVIFRNSRRHRHTHLPPINSAYKIHDSLKKDIQVIMVASDVKANGITEVEGKKAAIEKIMKKPWLEVILETEQIGKNEDEEIPKPKICGQDQWNRIKQFNFSVEKEELKQSAFLSLYKTLPISRAVIFCGTRWNAYSLARKMDFSGHTVRPIPAGKKARKNVKNEFMAGISRVLIAWDGNNPLECGIDDKIPLVIFFDLPKNYEDYISKIGVTNDGTDRVVINVTTPRDQNTIKEFTKSSGATMLEVPMLKRKDFLEQLKKAKEADNRRLFNLLK